MGRQRLYPMDDEGGEELQVEATGAGEIPGVRDELGEGSLAAHRQNQHSVAKGGSGKEGDEEGGD